MSDFIRTYLTGLMVIVVIAQPYFLMVLLGVPPGFNVVHIWFLGILLEAVTLGLLYVPYYIGRKYHEN